MAEKEYIEREKINDYISKLREYVSASVGLSQAEYSFISDILTALENFPAADVAPMKRGHWESFDTTFYAGTDEFGEPKQRNGKIFYCHNSDCRYRSIIKTNFCPKCGCKMDGR